MKTIKFDLPIDGVKVSTLEELRDHFTTEIIGHYRSGLLAKWLRSRHMTMELAAVEALSTSDDAAILKSLCQVFDVEADNDVIIAATTRTTGENVASITSIANISNINYIMDDLSNIMEVMVDEILRVFPLAAHGGGPISWGGGEFSKGSLVAWTGRKSDQNTITPAPGVVVGSISAGTNVSNGDIIGWFKMSQNPKDYEGDLYGLKMIFDKRNDALSSLTKTLDYLIEERKGSYNTSPIAHMKDRLDQFARNLDNASKIIYNAYQKDEKIDILCEKLKNSQAAELIFRSQK